MPGSNQWTSGKSSPSSSLASQLLSRSLERTATASFSLRLGVEKIPSPSLNVGTLQIQRSPSVEFDDDAEMDVESLRQLMSEHDEKFASQVSNTTKPSLDVTAFVSSIMEDEVFKEPTSENLSSSIGSANETGGGLVGALSKYHVGDSLYGSRDNPLTKKMQTPVLGGSPTQLCVVPEVSSRPASYMSLVGMRVVGSEPPSYIPPQAIQSFLRTQQQVVVSGSFDQRRGQMVSEIFLDYSLEGCVRSHKRIRRVALCPCCHKDPAQTNRNVRHPGLQILSAGGSLHHVCQVR